MIAPLVPHDVDLRGMPWMPLDTVRLIDSDLFALSTGDEFKAAVALWCKSWTQKPAASLPSDDRILAHLSGAGARWKKVKDLALRGWIACDDGRLYHPVIAKKALEAWEERVEYRDEKDNTDARKKREREWRKAAFDALRGVGIIPAWNEKTGTLRDLIEQNNLAVTVTNDAPVTPPVTPKSVTGHAPVTAKTGTGTGTGIHNSERERAGASHGTPEDGQLPEGVDPERWASYRDQLADDGKLSISRIKTALMQLRRVSQAGHDPNAVLTAAVMRGLRDLDDCAARLAREKAPPAARAGPGHAPPQSRQLQAIQALNEVTEHVTQDRTTTARLADPGTAGRIAQAGLPEPGVYAVR